MWELGWGGGGKSNEDVYEVIIMDDSLRKLFPDLREFNVSRHPHAREDFLYALRDVSEQRVSEVVLYALRSSQRSAIAWEIPYWHA